MIEHLVNLLTTELNSGRQENFLEQLRGILEKDALEFPPALTADTLEDIRLTGADLTQQWQMLSNKGKLELVF